MNDNRSPAVKAIHDKYLQLDCYDCPLKRPCATKVGDTKAIFDERMNAAAAEIESELTHSQKVTRCNAEQSQRYSAWEDLENEFETGD